MAHSPSGALVASILAAFAHSARADPPCSLQLLQTYPDPVRAMDVEGDRIVLSRLDRIDIARLKPDGSITTLSSIASPVPPPPTSHGVDIVGDRVVVLRGTGVVMPTEVQVYDISDPSQPVLLGASILSPEYEIRRALLRDMSVHLLAATQLPQTPRIITIDLSLPDYPLVEQLNVVRGLDIALDGDSLLVTGVGDSNPAWIKVLNAADPALLPELASLDLPYGGSRLAIENDRLYSMSDAGLVCVVDISDPRQPISLSPAAADYTGPTYPFLDQFGDDLAVRDGVAYLLAPGTTSGEPHLVALRVADPFAVAAIAEIDIDDGRPIEASGLGVLVGSNEMRRYSFPTCPCPADLNGDGQVDMADLMLAIDAFNTTPNDPNYNPAADANGDNAVDFADLNLVLSAFNSGC